MGDDEKLVELLHLAQSLGIEVRQTPAAAASGEHSAGALIRLKGREILLMDPTAPVSGQIALAAQALRGRDELEERFIKPAIRCLLNSCSGRAGAADEPHWASSLGEDRH